MKRMTAIGSGAKLAIGLFSIAALFLAPLQVVPQEKTADKPAAAQPARPGAPEMEKLKFYVGEWDYTETYSKSTLYPNGGKNTGVYTSKLGPGGNSLINTFHSQGPVGDFEGLLILTWDLREKTYKEFVFGDYAPGAFVQNGAFEGDSLIFRSERQMEGRSIFKLRNVTRLVAPGKLESDQYYTINDGPEQLMVHVEATKRM
jgi:hypothetical protein